MGVSVRYTTVKSLFCILGGITICVPLESPLFQYHIIFSSWISDLNFKFITEVVEQYIDPNTGIPITVEQLQAMYHHQQQPEVMYTEDGQPIQQVWPQQQVIIKIYHLYYQLPVFALREREREREREIYVHFYV